MKSSPIQTSSSGNNRRYKNADTRFSANVWSKMEVFSDQLSRKRVFTALGAIVGCFGKQTETTAGFWENQLLLFFLFVTEFTSGRGSKMGIVLNLLVWRKMWKSQFEIKNDCVMLDVCVDLTNLTSTMKLLNFCLVFELLSWDSQMWTSKFIN